MRPWILLAGVNGAMAIGMAAYGAHGVPPALQPLMDRASLFQLIHAVALLSVDRLGREAGMTARLGGGLWAAGVVLFSGSLYIKALSGPLSLPMITPAGGIALLAGWVVMSLVAFRRGSHPVV